MYQSYGGVAWTNQDPVTEHSALGNGLQLGVAAGAGYGLFRYGLGSHRDGGRRIDRPASFIRTIGNLSPFQIGNAFRVPEFMSAFASNDLLGIDGQVQWGEDALKPRSTYHYLRTATGLDDAAMRAAGLYPGQQGVEAASSLIYRRADDALHGTLHTVVNGEERLLAENMGVMALSPEIDPFLRTRHKVNAAAHGMMQALGLFSVPGFNPDRVLAQKGINQVLPIPSTQHGGLMQRSAYMRSYAAFEMGRFNRLMGGVAEQFLGESGSKFVGGLLGNGLFGAGNEVLSGTSQEMFTRYGLRTARVAGVLGAYATADWLRREGGDVTHLGVSAGIGAMASHAASRTLRFSPHSGKIGVGVAAAQMILPGFDQGIPQGFATLGVKALELRGSDLNPFGHYRRVLEGFLPGISSVETGLLASTMAVTAAYAKLPGDGRRLPELLLEKYGHQELGLRGSAKVRGSVRDIFWENVRSDVGLGSFGASRSWAERRGIASALRDREGSSYLASRFMNRAWSQAEEESLELSRNNPMTKALLEDLEITNQRYSGSGPLGKVLKEGEGFLKQAKYSFFGAEPAFNKEIRQQIRSMGFSGPTGRLGRLGTIAAAAYGAQQLLTGGLLGSMQDRGELKEIYEGGKPVPVRRSRFWESGSQPFGGGDSEYHRPHLYYLWMNRVKEKGIWGDDAPSPLGKFLRKNFTYSLEEQHYYDRPHPMTSVAFQDVPIIGGALAATIGRIVKPAKVMHPDAWIRATAAGGMEFGSTFEGSYKEPGYSLGAPGPGVPIAPNDPRARLAFMQYQSRELSGLTGYAKNVVQELITGEQQWSVHRAIMSDAGAMTDPRKAFWDMGLGGALGSSEVIRRILPAFRSDVEKLNPIYNSMPSWLPDKFRQGSPLDKMEWGDARLPGKGYEALHPEISNTDPEAYPLIHRYMILSDVAPMSAEFRRLQQQMYRRRAEGITTGWENKLMDRSDRQVQRVLSGLDWDRVREGAVSLPGSGLTQDLSLGAQQLLRTVAAPVEYVTPFGFRPFQKFMANRDPIEEYESRRMIGQGAFWDKPWRDWFRPALYSGAKMMGYDGKPMWRQKADEVNGYFDQLEFVKYMELAEQARAAGDSRGARSYEWSASRTRFGVNPQGAPLGIYWSLPQEEKPFFNAFAHAQGNERDRVLEMVPKDMAHLYQQIWKRKDAGDPSLYAGDPAAPNPEYMRQQYFGLANQLSRPERGWVGYHPDVDLEDVKVRYVDQHGSDLADYGLYDSALRKSMGQSFLDGSETEIAPHVNAVSTMSVHSALNRRLGMGGQRGQYSVTQAGSASIALDFNDSREVEIADLMAGIINGY
jgi:hypothetical protein